MARSRVRSDRFQTPATATERVGTCDLAPNLYEGGKDQYGFHFRRVLPDGQYIDYTVTPAGMLIEKINFVPSKERRDGNGAYGNRWVGICKYRQSADYVADLEFAEEHGMQSTPPAKAGKSASSRFVAVSR